MRKKCDNAGGSSSSAVIAAVLQVDVGFNKTE